MEWYNCTICTAGSESKINAKSHGAVAVAAFGPDDWFCSRLRELDKQAKQAQARSKMMSTLQHDEREDCRWYRRPRCIEEGQQQLSGKLN